MRFSSAIKKYVAPQFEKQGYDLKSIDSVFCNFENAQGTASVTFTKVKLCAELLDEYLKILEKKGPRMPPPAITVSYGIIATDKKGLRSVTPYSFKLGCPLESSFYIYDNESLIAGLGRLTRQSLDIVCPYLETVASQVILWEEAPYHLLKNQPEKLAVDFSKKYNIPMLTEVTDGKAVRQNIQDAFFKLLPEHHNERRVWFMENLGDIAGLAAFCGEQLLRYCPGRWADMGVLENAEQVGVFGVQFNDLDSYEGDTLLNVVLSWNYSPQVSGRGLFKRDFQKLFD